MVLSSTIIFLYIILHEWYTDFLPEMWTSEKYCLNNICFWQNFPNRWIHFFCITIVFKGLKKINIFGGLFRKNCGNDFFLSMFNKWKRLTKKYEMLQTFVFEYYLIIVRALEMTHTHRENKNSCSVVTYFGLYLNVSQP